MPPGGQFELSALIENLAAGIERFQRCREILLLQMQLRQLEVITLLVRISPDGCLQSSRRAGVIRRFRIENREAVQHYGILRAPVLRVLRRGLRLRRLMLFPVGLSQSEPHSGIVGLEFGACLQPRFGHRKVALIERDQTLMKGSVELRGEESDVNPDHGEGETGAG